ncbi:TPA: LPXTG cell wall anchor domain-containing protein [Streptococcus suis]|uniref:Cell wall surface anchor family protein n=1 Tax=Streptococcus suis TaxID=1307 RepID=A0A123TU61_STRSU|nr:LPXTG cell wall anchor domain-containing protein [Streptococcus suis]MBM0272564.1 LPXTG cell wall anchor domain-containing protein [Streptococcus suis]MCL4899127.1 LPXTG cell wall anchor domain-containing protein [Streptococcus suis]MCP8329991.1 LPXTG cell wall anchor domain-containing protein [Streptococcus suis]MCP8380626.1 LPXTG cell wall anchor domain-containing protein [Streptococcus suis]MCP8649091.1 LPXTG cell wall anchor domain-containing protein [Streptococcus suis]
MLFSKHHTIRFVSVVALLTAGLGSMPTILAEETDVATNKTELDFRANTVDGNNTASGEGNMPDLANKPESETNVATNKEQLSGKAIEITVQDEDATPLSSQLVELKTSSNESLGSRLSDQNGKVSFTDKIVEGTFYEYYVNGEKIGEVFPGQSRFAYLSSDKIVKEEASSYSSKKEETEEKGFTFTATIINKNGKVLADKEVQIVDTSTREHKVVATNRTNAKGQAIFNHLPLNINLSVVVDGVAQGYTLRANGSESQLGSSFIAEGEGTVDPEFSMTPLTVVIRNAGANPVSGQEVTLVDKTGRSIGTLRTNADGRAIFKEGLLDGTFYTVLVNGKVMSEVMTGMERSIYLSNKEIIKPSPAEKTHIKTEALIKEKFLSDRGKTQPSSGSKKENISEKMDSNKGKETSSNKMDTKKSSATIEKTEKKENRAHRQMLPNTGEKNGIATLLGFLLLLVFPFLRKKSGKNA